MAEGDLNQTSLQVGKLMAGVEALQTDFTAFRAELREHNLKTKQQVDDLLEFKNKGLGVLFGVSIVAGSVGSWLHSVWESFKGHGVG